MCCLVTESCVSLLPKSVHYCYQNLSTPDYRNLCTSRYRLQLWFNWDGDPYECKVMGVKVTDNSMTVIAHDKICNDEVTCSTPFELGAKNIDWLYEIYDAVWQQLEENRDNNA